MLPIGDVDVQRSTTPYITYILICANIVVFLYELFIAGSLITDSIIVTQFFYKWGVIPAELTHGENVRYLSLLVTDGTIVKRDIIDVGSPIHTSLTIFSSMFIHGGWLHILGNMLFLWVFGDNIEDRFGHVRFFVFYLAAGVAAVGAQVALNPDSQAPMIGASGAISGVTGAYLILFPLSRIRTLIMVGLIMVVHLPAILVLGIWFLLQAFQGVGSLGEIGGGVAYWAHIGGFLIGMITAIAYKVAHREPLWPTRRRNPWDNFPPGYINYR